MAYVDASLVQQIFDIPKRERKSDVQHHRKADDLRAGFEVLEGGRSGHSQKLRNRPTRLNPSSSDKTLVTFFILGWTMLLQCFVTLWYNYRNGINSSQTPKSSALPSAGATLWAGMSGAVRQIRTSLSLPRKPRTYPEQS